MKRILILILAAAALMLPAQKASAELTIEGADLSLSPKHPRILATDKEFKEYKSVVLKGENKYLNMLHEAYLSVADKSVEENQTIEFKQNAAGKLLGTSRETLKQVLACAYAYRFTGSKQYLKRAEKILDDVCSFETWHPEHYLDVAEMSTAVGLAYDWLYNKMDKNVREKARKALVEKGLDPAESDKFRKRFHARNNWGQVLNAGLIVNAMAVYEENPERSKSLIKRAVEDCYEKMRSFYTDDGVYPEGSGYWSYGTMFQLLAEEALFGAYGTDFGLSDIPGWKKTAYFKISIAGNTGKTYNYSDGGEGKGFRLTPELWYFANRVNGTDVLYINYKILDNADKVSFEHRLGAMLLLEIAKTKVEEARQPESNVFAGVGRTPVVLARTGWNKNDLFLGVKGGQAHEPHAHMDAGSFVYEAYGVRWAMEAQTDGYTIHEVNIPKINKKKSLWNFSQDSWRWYCPGYNNKEHNTLTVNGHDHYVDGYAPIEEVFDSPEAKGARINLSATFKDDLVKAVRTVIIKNDEYLEITDVLAAPADRPAEVRWTWDSPMAPSAKGESSLDFKNKKTTMRLETDAPGAKTTTWSTDPADYPENPTSAYIKRGARKKMFLSGFVFTVPAGEEITVTTTFKKAN